MPQLVIVTKKANWKPAIESLVRVPKNLTVQCREPGAIDVRRDYPVHIDFSSDVAEHIREDLLEQLRVHFLNTHSGILPELFNWFKR